MAVSVVVNVEEGAELAVSMGDERNESRYEVVDEVVGALERILAHVTARERVWLARRDAIAAHWRGLHGLAP